jgi:hypothetical protein
MVVPLLQAFVLYGESTAHRSAMRLAKAAGSARPIFDILAAPDPPRR